MYRSGYERIEDEEETILPGQPYVQPKVGWDHWQNLDKFLTAIYNYHQQGGLYVIFADHLFAVIKFCFIFFILIEFSVCTKWSEILLPSNKISQWSDVFIPPRQCWSSLSAFPSFILFVAIILLVIQLIRSTLRIKHYADIRTFCCTALELPTNEAELGDIMWNDVRKKLLLIQNQMPLCARKEELDELDVCNRILRHENYLIALINREIIPVRFPMPKLLSNNTGYCIYLPDGYLFNVNLLLFWSPWSPFRNYFQLKSDYKWLTKRRMLADQLSRRIMYLGLINLVLSPIILIVQLLVLICQNAEKIRYEPSSLFGRRWSNYSRYVLRHYNEMTHEFVHRLSNAYEPATRYLDCYPSRLVSVAASNIAFMAGGASVLLIAAAFICDDFFHLPGYVALAIGTGFLSKVCLSVIPNEYAVYHPVRELLGVLRWVHYMQDNWKENAHTSRVRMEFSKLFQYKCVGLIEDLLSPLLTPFILIFVLPKKSQEIVDFFRNYTVEQPGVGDVCSYAQMDIQKHGDNSWHPEGFEVSQEDRDSSNVPSNMENEPQLHTVGTFGGKTELSLMHFHLTNPSWRLPSSSEAFLKSVHNRAVKDVQEQDAYIEKSLHEENAESRAPSPTPGLFTSLCVSTENMGQKSYADRRRIPGVYKKRSNMPGSGETNVDTYGVISAMQESQFDRGKADDLHISPALWSSRRMLRTSSIMGTSSMLMHTPNLGMSTYQPYVSQTEDTLLSPQMGLMAPDINFVDTASLDASVSSLYIHELHQRKKVGKNIHLKQPYSHMPGDNGSGSGGIGTFGVVNMGQYQQSSASSSQVGYGSAMPPYQAAPMPKKQQPGIVIRSAIHSTHPEGRTIAKVREEEEDDELPLVDAQLLKNSPPGVFKVPSPMQRQLSSGSRTPVVIRSEEPGSGPEDTPITLPDLPPSNC